MKIAAPQDVIGISQIEVTVAPSAGGGPPDLKRVGEITERHGLQTV